MSKVIKKADILLIIFLIICGLAASFYISRSSADSGRKAVISVKGELYGKYDLSEDRNIDLGTGNIVSIRKGYVHMKKADCHGQDCIREGRIKDPGQTIVCLPHKVVIEIEGGSEEYDTISK